MVGFLLAKAVVAASTGHGLKPGARGGMPELSQNGHLPRVARSGRTKSPLHFHCRSVGGGWSRLRRSVRAVLCGFGIDLTKGGFHPGTVLGGQPSTMQRWCAQHSPT